MRNRIIPFILSFTLPLFAEPTFFVGAGGDVSFPGVSDMEKTFGLGGGASGEAGLYIGNFSAGILAGVSVVNDSGSLVESMTEVKIGAEAGYTFDKTVFPFLPGWLGIRPNGALLIDFYEADGYRSKSKKTIGVKETSEGVAFAGECSVFLDVVNLLKTETFMFIPTVGYNQTFRVEEDGPVFSGRLSAGIRITYTPPKPVDYDEWLAGLSGGSLTVKAPTRSKTFSPNGDGTDDIVEFDVTSDADKHGGVASWELRVYDPGNTLFWSQKGKGEIPAGFVWNGESLNGDAVESGALYQYVWYVKARDNSDGFIPGLISTGIMIKEHDGVLSFSLSSIQFGPDSSEFDNISEEQSKRNNELFDAVAEILQRYREYNITVEGHANNVSGTEREHREELLPLSQKRAETVKRELVKRGIPAERMVAVGRGSEVTISTKPEDWWKNRRVEFILKPADENSAVPEGGKE
ncbi:MAG: OmpA family protein [Treponema sp.]|nr:OmpA family protein [Treponema sp.]